MQLTCNKLSFQYPDNGTKVLDRLSFTLRGPGFLPCSAPPGRAKTSLARIISAVMSEYRGDLRKAEIL